MREIKFNAWIPSLKYMLEEVSVGNGSIGFPADDEDFQKCLTDNGFDSETYDLPEWLYDTAEDWFHITDDKEFILLQYTGLNDKNDTPVYEGHIVSITDNTGDTYFYNIQWKPDCYMMVGDGGPGEWLSLEEFEGCIIVGNKYENPELNPR